MEYYLAIFLSLRYPTYSISCCFFFLSPGIPFPNKVAVHNLDLPMNDNDEIHCIDVLQALLKRVLGKEEPFA